MKFNNRQNEMVTLQDGRVIWISRSVAVVGAIFAWRVGDELPYVLTSTRGPKSADFQGMENLVCGYLDWDETGSEAIIREVWEETGLNLVEVMESGCDMINNIDKMWDYNDRIDSNNQNITHRYGLCFAVDVDKEFPVLTTEHNEVVGEVENPRWLRIDKIDEFQWAFGHSDLIKKYMEFIFKQVDEDNN